MSFFIGNLSRSETVLTLPPTDKRESAVDVSVEENSKMRRWDTSVSRLFMKNLFTYNFGGSYSNGRGTVGELYKAQGAVGGIGSVLNEGGSVRVYL